MKSMLIALGALTSLSAFAAPNYKITGAAAFFPAVKGEQRLGGSIEILGAEAKKIFKHLQTGGQAKKIVHPRAVPTNKDTVEFQGKEITCMFPGFFSDVEEYRCILNIVAQGAVGASDFGDIDGQAYYSELAPSHVVVSPEGSKLRVTLTGATAQSVVNTSLEPKDMACDTVEYATDVPRYMSACSFKIDRAGDAAK